MINSIVMVDDDNERRCKLNEALVKLTNSVSEFAQIPEQVQVAQDSLYLLHVGNEDGVDFFVEKLLSSGCEQIVGYSAGGEDNFDFYIEDFAGTLLTDEINPLNCDWPIYIKRVNQFDYQDLINTVQTLINGKPETSKTTKLNPRSEFEKRRTDLSHDCFKNGFRNPLSYGGSDKHSDSRFAMFREARNDELVWTTMCGVAQKWPALAIKIEQLMVQVPQQAIFVNPTNAYLELQQHTKAAIEQISCLMAKFCGPDHLFAALMENEITDFWQAMDVVDEWFKSLATNDKNTANGQFFHAVDNIEA